MDKYIVFLIIWFSIIAFLIIIWLKNCIISIKKNIASEDKIKVVQT